MKLKVLGSGSTGNCYILESPTEVLIIEAGVRFREVKKALNFNISKIVGCIVSHEHDDHAGHYRDYVSIGFPLLSSETVYNKKGKAFMPPWAKIVEPNKGYSVGKYKVIPFHVKHDVPCFGFLIDHPDMGRLLFATDTMMLEYTFPKLNHIMLEANYADDILDEKIAKGSVPPSMRPRLRESHMELETAKDILRSNDLSQVSDIILIHLSNGNSHEERFIREIKEVCGKPVYVADKGREFDLSLNPY